MFVLDLNGDLVIAAPSRRSHHVYVWLKTRVCQYSVMVCKPEQGRKLSLSMGPTSVQRQNASWLSISSQHHRGTGKQSFNSKA